MTDSLDYTDATCDICGASDKVSHAALIASSGLSKLPAPALAWLEATYSLMPHVACAGCFIPALSGANQAWATAVEVTFKEI